MRNHLTFRAARRSMLVLLMACSTPKEPEEAPLTPDGAQGISYEVARYESAIQRAKAEPAAALVLCQGLKSEQLKEDCVAVVATELAKQDLLAGETACSSLNSPYECFFRLAEVRADTQYCARAGPLEIDCRLHVFSFGLKEWLAKDSTAETILAKAPSQMVAAGLASDDFRPWTALWRWRLGAAVLLDRSLCAGLHSDWQTEICLQAGGTLFHDRLNHFRDKGIDLCTGDLPPALNHTEDPALDLVLADRRAGDLCDPSAVHAPPTDRIPGSTP
jgi:hypothetical protein